MGNKWREKDGGCEGEFSRVFLPFFARRLSEFEASELTLLALIRSNFKEMQKDALVFDILQRRKRRTSISLL